MTKLVLKTVAITLASVIGALALMFGAFALFSPVSIATVFDGMGSYSSATHFYEMQYNKTGSLNDLSTLALKLDEEHDSVRTEKYLAILIEDFKDSNDSDESLEISNKEFYYGKYVLSLVNNSKFDNALEEANQFVEEEGYTSGNPFSILISKKGTYLTAEQLGQIKQKIAEYSPLENVTQDIARIDALTANS